MKTRPVMGLSSSSPAFFSPPRRSRPPLLAAGPPPHAWSSSPPQDVAVVAVVAGVAGVAGIPSLRDQPIFGASVAPSAADGRTGRSRRGSTGRRRRRSRRRFQTSAQPSTSAARGRRRTKIAVQRRRWPGKLPENSGGGGRGGEDVGVVLATGSTPLYTLPLPQNVDLYGRLSKIPHCKKNPHVCPFAKIALLGFCKLKSNTLDNRQN
jgi:hypothetical protein